MSVSRAPDWFIEPFNDDGSVDWPSARAWVGDMHAVLLKALGSDAWTNEMAGWLGRLTHDALAWQGVMLTRSGPDDLEDLLFTLLPSRQGDLPGSPESAVQALRALFIYGVHEAGAVAAAHAVTWLDASNRTEELGVALGLQQAIQRKPARKRMPRRKKNNHGKKRRNRGKK